jgi:NAD(P)-dependent dehydrogenase (short-subunit alcohol dehydrogenase family)
MTDRPPSPDHKLAVFAAWQKTMRVFLEGQEAAMRAVLGGRNGSTPSLAEPQVVLSADEPVGRVERFVMRGRKRPLPSQADGRLAGLYLVAGDADPLGRAVIESLRDRGAAPASIPSALLRDHAALAAEVRSLREKFGPVCGVIHLTGLQTGPMPRHILDWRTITALDGRGLFILLNVCAEDLRQRSGLIASLSGLGGSFGRAGWHWRGVPSSGAAAGMLKTVAIEWSEVAIKAIDFGDATPEQIGAAVANEALSRDGAQEIGYCHGSRVVFDATVEPLPALEEQQPPSPDWVVLATGGARGITAEALHGLLVPGMTLVLVGRAAEPEIEPDSTLGVSDIATLRQIFLERLREKGEPVTPVQVQRQIADLLRDRDIRRNLDQWREHGVNVEYHAADVRSPGEFGRLIDSIYERHGRIDAVIHGAGVIEDKLLVDKSPDSFSRVFDTKADSTFILAEWLRPESLKWLVFFTSVAGRTGNRGQCDYAAANEVVNRFAWWLHHRWPAVKIRAINWGPWESGMASEEVNRQFRERGVIPIPPADGRAFLRNEMLSNDRGSVELVAGIFERPEHAAGVSAFLPLLHSAPQVESDGGVTLDHTWSMESHPFLGDHRLDGTPVIPAVVAMELMAEAVQAAWPDWQIREVLEHRVQQGIQLKGGAARTLSVRARALDGGNVTAEIVDLTRPQVPMYRANFLLTKNLPPPPRLPDPVPSTGAALDAAEAYAAHCFHGPKFQRIRTIEGLDEHGLDATVESTVPAEWMPGAASEQEWLFDPGLLDAGLQAVLIWCRVQLGAYTLPSFLGRVSRYGTPPAEAGNLQLCMRILGVEGAILSSEFSYADREGKTWLRVEGIQSTISKALNRLAPKPLAAEEPAPAIT